MIPLLLFALSCLNPRAAAQSFDAVPQAGFEFFNNVFGESPCVVASKIFARCQNSTFTLWSLPAGNWAYPGPTNSSQEWWNWNRCDCSMPVYNLLSACAESQGASWPSFFQHTEKCNFEYTGDNEGAIYSLPIELPTNTQLPSWAMFNSSENKGSTFTDRQARLDAGLSVDKKGSDRTPFLIGGVVGVIALLGIGALVLIWSRRRSAKKREHQLKKMAASASQLRSDFSKEPFSQPSSHGHNSSSHSVSTSEFQFQKFAFPPEKAHRQEGLRSRSNSISHSKGSYPVYSSPVPMSDRSWAHASTNNSEASFVNLDPPTFPIKSSSGHSERLSNLSWFAGSEVTVVSSSPGQGSPALKSTFSSTSQASPNYSSKLSKPNRSSTLTATKQSSLPLPSPTVSTRSTNDIRMPPPQTSVAYPTMAAYPGGKNSTSRQPKRNVPELQEQNTDFAFYPIKGR